MSAPVPTADADQLDDHDLDPSFVPASATRLATRLRAGTIAPTVRPPLSHAAGVELDL